MLALGKQRKKNQELGSFVCIVNVQPAWCTSYSVSHNHKIKNIAIPMKKHSHVLLPVIVPEPEKVNPLGLNGEKRKIGSIKNNQMVDM